MKAAFRRLDGEMFEGISDEEKQKLIDLYSRMAVNLYKEGTGKPLSELMNELRRLEDDEKA